jgi:hypothetical protein
MSCVNISQISRSCVRRARSPLLLFRGCPWRAIGGLGYELIVWQDMRENALGRKAPCAAYGAMVQSLRVFAS